MQYREFGNTGVKISALGFGCMRFEEIETADGWRIDEEKALPMLERAFELGVNYYDTAWGYCHEQSQYVVGKFIADKRDKVLLSTKVPTWDVKKTGDYRRLLEEQLRRLDTDYIDFYHFHSLSGESFDRTVKGLELIKEALRAKEEGLIRHISYSFHDRTEEMVRIMEEAPMETVLCQYNLLDRSNEESIAKAREKGLGTVIMGPVAGGRLAVTSEVLRSMMNREVIGTPEIALRFVLSNPNVCCALSGMSTIEQVEQNAAIASDTTSLTEQERHNVSTMLEEVQRMSDLYCTGCDYCQPCPKGIRIPHLFSLMNYHRVYGLTEYAKSAYSQVGKEEGAGSLPSACAACGKCEKACPQKIHIIEKLKEVEVELGG